MAVRKAKRPLLLAQHQRRSPNTEPSELMPVKTHAYRTLAELNGGFDKVIQELQALGQVSYFRSDRVTAMHDLLCRVRAEANRDFTLAVHEREKVNAGIRERLFTSNH
jgi:hypothetical protein